MFDRHPEAQCREEIQLTMSTPTDAELRDVAMIYPLAGGLSVAEVAARNGESEHYIVWRLTDAAFRRRVHLARVELARAAAAACTDLAETLAGVELPEWLNGVDLPAYVGATLGRVSAILSHLAGVIAQAGPLGHS
jgi:hypothetical protein